ncbi:MAG: hydroxyacid dehydrogenase [Armatimonadota bacterium]|nr:hydroxyacid dehydrogenase [Armatimonadota bacterium]MDR5703799.1 hydroxyacid dehydrogenase [Armatimonadota bacterium]
MTEESSRPPLFVLSDAIHPEAMAWLSRIGIVKVLDDLAPKDHPVVLAEADALIVRRPSFQVTRELISTCPRLRVIGRHGAGVDNVDLQAATEAGIPVTYTPSAPTDSVAELTIGLIVAVARRIVGAHQAVCTGIWHREQFMGMELAGKVLGIIGFGSIGRAVARIAQAMGMRIVAYDPYVSRWPEGVQPVSLRGLLERADVVTIHAPLTSETKGLLGRSELAVMKPGAILVNTARGEIVDEEALAEALREGRLGGAGIDVFSREPIPREHPLLHAPNVVLTPHIGAMTEEAQRRMAMTVVEDVLRVLSGERPSYLANPEVLR